MARATILPALTWTWFKFTTSRTWTSWMPSSRAWRRPDPKAEWIGALAALRDYRDGTNLTGLNPKDEKLIRHIGITGHFSSPVLMECLQRDTVNVIDTLLVAMNANDRRYFNHQYNVIPVAAAKNLGIIAMKVFADGAITARAIIFPDSPRMWCGLWAAGQSPALPSLGTACQPRESQQRSSASDILIATESATNWNKTWPPPRLPAGWTTASGDRLNNRRLGPRKG